MKGWFLNWRMRCSWSTLTRNYCSFGFDSSMMILLKYLLAYLILGRAWWVEYFLMTEICVFLLLTWLWDVWISFTSWWLRLLDRTRWSQIKWRLLRRLNWIVLWNAVSWPRCVFDFLIGRWWILYQILNRSLCSFFLIGNYSCLRVSFNAIFIGKVYFVISVVWWNSKFIIQRFFQSVIRNHFRIFPSI